MADISLRDYLAKLDDLLESGSADEVIHHCRHILQYYPKSAETYRCLGRALLYAGAWERAAEVFRRVLSVYPDDYVAHVGLSEAYLSLRRPDDAIWHMERAFEQDPNNQEILDSLREMYRKFRRVEQAKVQLTAGAVARQYIRNGLYEQAIDTLRQVLERSPERVDLRLLLACTYEDAGRQLEAAEAAVDVLKTLADCLEANRILTEMWLAAHRPSDAQRYLNRIESVDPYLALELAKGQPPADDPFRLEELDYRRTAQEEIISRAPDWLQAIQPAVAADALAEADYGDWMRSVAAPAAEEPEEELLPDISDETFSTDLPQDWLTSQPDTSTAAPATADRPHTGFTGLLSALGEAEAEQAEAPPDGMLAFDEVEAESEALPDESPELFPAVEPAVPAAPQPPPAPDADDPLAWLHGSGIELADEPAPALFDEEDDVLSVQAADEVNPLAWLEGYGDQFITEEARSAAESPMAVEETPVTDDALDWMLADAEPVAGEAPVGEPLAWLADETSLEEALSLEELTVPGAAEASSDDIGWAQDTTLESDRQDSMTDENPFEWLDSQDDDQNPMAEPPPDLDADDWFAGLEAPEAGTGEAAEQPIPGEPGGDFEWITGEAEQAERAGGMLDWLSPSSEPSPQAESASEPADWPLSSEPLPEEAAAADEMPAWMAELGAADSQDAEPPAEPVGDVPDWLSEAQPSETAEEAEPVGDVPDWLSEAQPSETAEVGEPAAEPVGDAPDWLMEAQPSETAEEAEPAAEPVGEVPDWLAEAQPSEMAEEAAPDWLAEMRLRQPEAAEPPIEDISSWADQRTADQEEPGGEPAAEYAWPSDEQPAVSAGEVPEWLAQLESQQPEAEAQELEAAGELAWMDDLAGEEEETEQGASAGVPAEAAPDWLSQTQPQTEAGEETFTWMEEFEEGEPAAAVMHGAETRRFDTDDEWADEPAAAAEQVPDWLSALKGPEAPEPESEPVVSEFAWIDDMNAQEAVPEEESAAGVTDFDAEPEADWAETDAEPLASAPAGNAPDWLNAMVPGLDVDYTAPEDAPIEQTYSEDVVEHRTTRSTTEVPAAAPPRSDFDWLVDIVDEESQPVPAVEDGGIRKRFRFSRLPQWLRRPVEQHDDAPAGAEDAGTNDSSDLPPWLQ